MAANNQLIELIDLSKKFSNGNRQLIPIDKLFPLTVHPHYLHVIITYIPLDW